MRILVAPQEFKGTLTALEAAETIAAALSGAFSDLHLDLLPMADGGPGTIEALLAANGGERRSAPAHDPLMRPIQAEWGLLPDGTVVIECASASGLLRLRPDELDARRATTLGTGELIAAALDAGCQKVIIGLGGSATNDGGSGMASALGFRLLDALARPLPPGGAALARLDRIDVSDVDPALAHTTFLAATDVRNPLCGPEGASAVYGPQKGADEAAVQELDSALDHFARVLKRDLGIDVAERPGAGAAGGLGAGVMAFLGGELRPGAELVAQSAGLKERVEACDLVITGEGRLDGQTSFGKAPAYVAEQARAASKPVICLVGRLGEGHEGLRSLFDVIEATSREDGGTPTREQASARLAAAAIRAVKRLF
jgi:glycerate 2-kinase